MNNNTSEFNKLKQNNQDDIAETKKLLLKNLAQHSYLKGFEKGITITEQAVEKNNVEFLILYFKEKLIYFKNWVVNKAELLNLTYPVQANVQLYYELKGELKAIKEFGAMYLSIDFDYEITA